MAAKRSVTVQIAGHRIVLRSDVDELYRQQNPSITLMHDYGWRNDDGTPGISELKRQTTLFHADMPLQDGKAFVRLERIGLDAGSFDLEDGQHTEAFGTCQVRGTTRSGDPLPAGCPGGSQTANGRIMAVGWEGERWAADLGTTDGFEVNNWVALFAPAGTPADIIKRWNAEVQRIMQSAEIQARLPNEGARFIPMTPGEFAAFVKAEIAKWAPVVKASGARVD